MDLFNGRWGWHPRYTALRADGQHLLLLSEGEPLVLASSLALTMADIMAQGRTLADHCGQVGHSHQTAQCLHALDQWHRQACAVPLESDGRPSADPEHHLVPPPASAVWGRVALTPERDMVMLSTLLAPRDAAPWSKALDHGRPLTVVHCDDLLDSRLGDIDRQQRAQGRDWLLVRTAGRQASLGPVFTPGTAGTACWHCLSQRLWLNQPLRAWWTRHRGAWPAIPLSSGPHGLAARLGTLQPWAHAMLAAPSAQIMDIGPAGQQQGRHAVAHRPQCPHCGDATLLARRQHQPWPSPSKGAATTGARSQPAEQTVARLLPHVSALCGVVTHLTAMQQPGEGESAGAVYSSAFHKTPQAEVPPWRSPMLQLCMGRGPTPMQAQASALCEAIERHAAFHQGDEARAHLRAIDADARCVLPGQLTASGHHDTGAAMHWAPAWSLTHRERVYLPLGWCYAHAPSEDTRHIGWTSNGCAAGNTLDEAVLHGFLELVERDAAAIWWYGRITRPAVASHALPMPAAQQADWQHWMLDITHDLGIPVVVAIARHRHDRQWIMGFGCALGLAQACRRAWTELMQLIATDKRVPVPDTAPGEDLPAFLCPDPKASSVPHRPAPDGEAGPLADMLAACLQAAASLGLETIALDYSRPDLPLHTVKVTVPGLSHIWPAYLTKRVVEVPLALGWRAPDDPPARNPLALYV